ncbi:MAG: hypothetical protein LCH51_06290 [Bacteroidetes bacterium]|nr:hypothetical protein [Bacteroidota bacterium]
MKKRPADAAHDQSIKEINIDSDKEKAIEEELAKMDYPAKEDIMNPASGAHKIPHANHHRHNIGDDLDIPGTDLDDDMEDIGEEDEENNYYSLGGDNND